MKQGARKTEAEQAGILVWGTIAAKAAQSLAPLVILYLMGESDVGAFAALMLVYNTVIVFMTAGFPRAVLYFLADRTPQERRLIVYRLSRLTFALGAAAGLVFLAVGLFGQELLDAVGSFMAERFGRTPRVDDGQGASDSLAYLPGMAVFALFDVPARLLPNVFVAEHRPRAAAGVAVVYSLGMACGTLVPAAAGLGVPGIVVGMAAFGAAYGAFYLGCLRRLYGGVGDLPAGTQVPDSRELVRYSYPLGITDIVATLNTSLDLWLITMFFPLDSVAHYKAGAWQIPVVTTVAYSVGAVYLPRYVSLYRAGKASEAIELWRESIRKVSLIVVPTTLVFMVGAEEFCRLIYPPGYEPAADVFRAYCFLTLGRVTAFGSLILAAGRPKYVLYAAAGSLASNAIISVPLVLGIGFLGPALGTAIAFVPTVYFYCYYIAKASSVPLRSTFPLGGYLRVVLAAVPGCALAIALKLLLPWDYRLVFALEAASIVGAYALVGTLMKLLAREDWRFIADWARLRVMR